MYNAALSLGVFCSGHGVVELLCLVQDKSVLFRPILVPTASTVVLVSATHCFHIVWKSLTPINSPDDCVCGCSFAWLICLRVLISALFSCALLLRHPIVHIQCNKPFLFRRKTEAGNLEGEAYFTADKAFLESMVTQRKLELDSESIV